VGDWVTEAPHPEADDARTTYGLVAYVIRRGKWAEQCETTFSELTDEEQGAWLTLENDRAHAGVAEELHKARFDGFGLSDYTVDGLRKYLERAQRIVKSGRPW
jgi:hypothetical protein